MTRIAIVFAVTVFLVGSWVATASAACISSVFTASAAGDLIEVMNVGGSAHTASFNVFDSAGTQQGVTFTTPNMVGSGRFTLRVGDLYDGALVNRARIKTTSMQAIVAAPTIVQVKTGGGVLQVSCP